MPRRCLPIRDAAGNFIGTVTVCERVRRCSCGRTAPLLCDFPVTSKGKRKTCDRPLCFNCARTVGRDRHHCKSHDPDPF